MSAAIKKRSVKEQCGSSKQIEGNKKIYKNYKKS